MNPLPAGQRRSPERALDATRRSSDTCRVTRGRLWFGVSSLGFVLAALLHFPGTLDGVGLELGPFIIGGVTGLVIGSMQVGLLRDLGRLIWLWPLATAFGFAATHGIGDGVTTEVGYLPVALIGGAATGALQAALLRRPAWAFATTGAFLIGLLGAPPLATVLGTTELVRQMVITGAVGVAYAALTVPLLKQARA